MSYDGSGAAWAEEVGTFEVDPEPTSIDRRTAALELADAWADFTADDMVRLSAEVARLRAERDAARKALAKIVRHTDGSHGRRPHLTACEFARAALSSGGEP